MQMKLAEFFLPKEKKNTYKYKSHNFSHGLIASLLATVRWTSSNQYCI